MKPQKSVLAGLVLVALAISGCGKSQPQTAVSTPKSKGSEAAPAQTAVGLTRFDARPGSKVRIEGTSNIHDWQVQGIVIGGFLEAGPGFPVEPAQTCTPGKVQARAEAFIPVRSLKSVEKDGRLYSDKMDEIMYGKLKSPPHARINYRLTELALKEMPTSKDAPYIFDSRGELVVAGITNIISMPVSVIPLGGKRLKLSGTTTVKMTDFGIEPPKLTVVVSITTGDEVRLLFEWIVEQKAVAAPDKA